MGYLSSEPAWHGRVSLGSRKLASSQARKLEINATVIHDSKTIESEALGLFVERQEWSQGALATQKKTISIDGETLATGNLMIKMAPAAEGERLVAWRMVGNYRGDNI